MTEKQNTAAKQSKRAKEWLSRARGLAQRLNALQESKQHAYDRAISATMRLEGVCVRAEGNSSPGDKNASYAVLSAEADEQIRQLETVRAEILRVIRQVEDHTLATLLTEYYVNNKTWEEVAAALHYSYSHVTHNLHPEALRAAQECIEVHTHLC